MRKITIIGAGQAGLQLGIGLLKHNYQVTLFTNRSAEEILYGHILSNQGMFDTALQYERDLGLNYYESQCPYNTSVSLTIAHKGQKAIAWKGFVDKPFQAIDQRLKFSRWMQEFEALKGRLIVQDITLSDLEELAHDSDLTIMASGKGSISQLFKRDNTKSVYHKPQRMLACHYVVGMRPDPYNPGVRSNIVPGIGEYFTMPGLTLSGPCEMMLFEGIPGTEFDCWAKIQTPEEQLEYSLTLLKKYLPWEAERCQHVQLTDRKATLRGSYTPEIRYPYFKLPSSNKPILGIGDAVVLNDPIGGQGANNASKAAKIYMDDIIAHQDKPFDEYWMQTVFNHYWRYAKWATHWSNLLLEPPQEHVINLLTAASHIPLLANKIANGFNDPASLFPWIQEAHEAENMLNLMLEQQEQTLEVIA